MQLPLRSICSLALIVVVLLSACSSLAGKQPAPVIPGLAQTLAAQTLTARDGPASPWTTPEPLPAADNPLAALQFAPTPLPEHSDPALPAEGGEAEPVRPVIAEEACTNQAMFVEDVSVPDWTQMKSGERFVKTWRFQNVGTCTWTPEYSVVFVWGDLLSELDRLPLGATVKPEEFINVSLELTAPRDKNYYSGNWMLEDPEGNRFGTGYKGKQFFWVSITVGNPGGRGGGLAGGWGVEGGCIKGG